MYGEFSMPIDIQSESLVSIKETPARLPSRPHVATVWRWIQRGCRGVKLETVLVGGRRFTSEESIQRFVEATTAAANGEAANHVPTRRRRAVEQAESEMDAAGLS